jgi:cob(I)alamin adenosyltransferase
MTLNAYHIPSSLSQVREAITVGSTIRRCRVVKCLSTRGGRLTESNVPMEPSEGPDADPYAERIKRRKTLQDRRMAETITDRGLVIVHTGAGKGKTTAALGMVLRSLGHGYRVAIVQFIKGAWEPAEKRAFEPWGEQLQFHATGEGFTWETQDKVRDKIMAQAGWEVALRYLADPEFHLVLLDEANIALKKGYLSIEQVLDGVNRRPVKTHVIITGRNAPDALLERADLVTEMTLIKHPLKLQHIRAQPGIEF